MQSGLLEVVSPPQYYYPNFTSIKETFGDSKDRVKYIYHFFDYLFEILELLVVLTVIYIALFPFLYDFLCCIHILVSAAVGSFTFNVIIFIREERENWYIQNINREDF